MIRVGIPRALLYYQYYPVWKTFFEDLGAETMVSPPTDKAIFASGNSRAVAETCLPVKIFFGHVIFLADKCDYMFIPVMRSLGGKAYHCSKFVGLPDMTKALVPECPPILDPEIDLTEGRHRLRHIILTLGRHFCSDKGEIETAAEKARETHLAYRREMSDKGITPIQALDKLYQSGKESNLKLDADTVLSVAVIGHPYVIYDDYVNHRFVSRLHGMGAKVLTPEMADQKDLDLAMTKLVGNPHWSFEADIIGAGEHYLELKVDGIITVAVFGCGPDSMMIDIVRHRARECRVPFLHISLDEHTSDGGLVTRLEAFIDMVKRRKRMCA